MMTMMVKVVYTCHMQLEVAKKRSDEGVSWKS